jgi:hypothetical protein
VPGHKVNPSRRKSAGLDWNVWLPNESCLKLALMGLYLCRQTLLPELLMQGPIPNTQDPDP